MRLICEKCGKMQDFKDEDEAFHTGWDEPSHFSHGHILCPDCPVADLVMKDVAAGQRQVPRITPATVAGIIEDFKKGQECICPPNGPHDECCPVCVRN